MPDWTLWAAWPIVCVGVGYLLNRMPGSQDPIDWFGGSEEEPGAADGARPAEQPEPARPAPADADGAATPLPTDGVEQALAGRP